MFTQKRAQLAASKDVNVQMVDGLAAVPVAVYLQSIAFITDALSFGSLVCHAHQVAYKWLLPRRYVSDCGYVLVRDDEEMNWRLRVNIPYNKRSIAFIKKVAFDFACAYFAKDTVCHPG